MHCNYNIVLFECAVQVYAIDISPQRIAMARHNAAIYGVERNISFICGDYFKMAADIQADVVFLSPPWGGPFYKFSDFFDVFSPMEGLNVSLAKLIEVRPAAVPPCKF